MHLKKIKSSLIYFFLKKIRYITFSEVLINKFFIEKKIQIKLSLFI